MDQLQEERSPGEVRGLSPRTRPPARVQPPGSKSLAIRALLAAGLARGSTRLERIPAGEDVQACLQVLRASGVALEQDGQGALVVHGRCPADNSSWNGSQGVPCGESGTLARFATAVYGFCGEADVEHLVQVSGTLLNRSSEALMDTLREAGVTLTHERGEGTWPVRLRSQAPGESLMLQNPASSQELSGLLLALAAHGAGPRGRSVLVMGGLPSAPYAAMTASVLRSFGAEVQNSGSEWRVRGPLIAPQQSLSIETDASGAAVALAAGCLAGRQVCVPGFQAESLQGDVAILDLLAAFGCEVERAPTTLTARGFPKQPAQLDLSATPDLAPVLAAVAGAYSLRQGPKAGSTHLTGLETLNGKECARIQVLAGGLRALGIEVQDTQDSLTIGACAGLRGGAEEELILDPHGDHRMAFAFALLGLVRDKLWVSQAGCVGKSWPGFWEEMGAESPSP